MRKRLSTFLLRGKCEASASHRSSQLLFSSALQKGPSSLRHYFTVTSPNWNSNSSEVESKKQKEEFKRLEKHVVDLQNRCALLESATHVDELLFFYESLVKTELNLPEIAERCKNKKYNMFLFCHRQLPIMMAKIVKQINSMPHGLSAMVSTRAVKIKLRECFYKLANSPIPISSDSEKLFLEITREIDELHESFIIGMAKGLLELRKALSAHRHAVQKQKATTAVEETKRGKSSRFDDYDDLAMVRENLQTALDQVNASLIEYNFVSKQLSLAIASADRRGSLVDPEMNFEDVVRMAMGEARQLCEEFYGDAPEVVFLIPNVETSTDCFPYYTESVRYIVKELGKNALRATVEKHMALTEDGRVTCDDMPKVIVTVTSSATQSHACVCVSDEGGGIPRHAIAKVMSCTYTTSPKHMLNDEDDVTEVGNAQSQDETEGGGSTLGGTLAGYGYGLPMSRIYARCFGGDVLLQSVEGFGTKAYAYIQRTGVLGVNKNS